SPCPSTRPRRRDDPGFRTSAVAEGPPRSSIRQRARTDRPPIAHGRPTPTGTGLPRWIPPCGTLGSETIANRVRSGGPLQDTAASPLGGVPEPGPHREVLDAPAGRRCGTCV